MPDRNATLELSKKFGVRREIIELLAGRGLAGPERLARVCAGGSANCSDPFELKGMREAAERIRQAADNDESVVIYGDYDADGICSVAILYLALQRLGINVNWYIPEREEGYGINPEAVEFIGSEYFPDLIITCDCGISAREEVAEIIELGIDVIVTDHHELPELLPDCVIVNPKQDMREDTCNLCGAGVAYKLAEALLGKREAEEYLDIAAIATVADSVELLGENRDIVIEGLKRINANPRAGVRALLRDFGQRPVTSSVLAFGIVPRINAAGRVGEAKRAMNLFSETDPDRIAEVVAELEEANTERQQLCETMLNELESSEEFKQQLKRNILVFAAPDWQSGVVGIVASKLCDRYKRPVFLFTEADGLYKGSGRSVPGINIFELLTAQKQILVRFGGHSQASGVSIEKRDLELFADLAEKYISDHFADFACDSSKYDMELSESEVNMQLAEDLMRLEPFGVGNRRPQFLVKSSAVDCRPMKNHPAHLVLKLKNFDITAFNYGAYSDFFCGDYEKRFVIDISVNEYKQSKYLKCVLRDCELALSSGDNRELLLQRYLAQLGARSDALPVFKSYSQLNDILNGDGGAALGTLLVCSLERTFESFLDAAKEGRVSFKNFCTAIFNTQDGNNISRLVLSPSENFEYSVYDRIIFLDRPLSGEYIAWLNARTGAEIYLPERQTYGFLRGHNISLSRSDFGAVFKFLERKGQRRLRFSEDAAEVYGRARALGLEVGLLQFSAAYSVFAELGLIAAGENDELVLTDRRAELSGSAFYTRLNRLLAAGETV